MNEKEKAARIIAPFLILAAQAGCTTPEVTPQTVIRNIPVSPSVESPKRVEEKPLVTPIRKPTIGTISLPTPSFFVPETNNPTNLQPSPKTVEVLNPTGKGRFLVKTPTDNLEIPLDQLEIQGNLSWSNRTFRLPWLGFDCAQPDLIGKIPEIGAGAVRIPIEQADEKFFNEHPYVQKAIQAARNNELRIMLLYNPGKYVTPQETETRMDKVANILGGYKNVSFEIGNEPDLDWFWKTANLDSFSQFIAETSPILKQKMPYAEQIIGGVSQREAILPLLQALRRNGVNPNNFSVGVHAYNSSAEVQARTKILQNELDPKTKLIFTEIGWNQSQDDKGEKVISMIEAGKTLGVKEFYIFQLRNIPFAGSPDAGLWGYVEPNGKWEKQVWSLVDYIWRMGKIN